MKSQILRIISTNKKGINGLGGEEYRRTNCTKSMNLEPERTHLNMHLIEMSEPTLYQTWKKNIEGRNLKVNKSDKAKVMEQMLITASPAFFEELGWDKEAAKGWTQKDIPKEIINYFKDSLDFLIRLVGRENILSATIHFDETSVHMHASYICAISGTAKRKEVMLKDENGKCIYNERGHTIRARDENGKVIYEYVDVPPQIVRSEFYRQKTGQDKDTYRWIQNKFHEEVGKKYNLERGEIGSDRKHVEQAKHEAKKAASNKEKLSREVQELERANESFSREIDEKVRALNKYDDIIDSNNQEYMNIAIENERLQTELKKQRKKNELLKAVATKGISGMAEQAAEATHDDKYNEYASSIIDICNDDNKLFGIERKARTNGQEKMLVR